MLQSFSTGCAAVISDVLLDRRETISIHRLTECLAAVLLRPQKVYGKVPGIHVSPQLEETNERIQFSISNVPRGKFSFSNICETCMPCRLPSRRRWAGAHRYLALLVRLPERQTTWKCPILLHNKHAAC